MAPRRNADLLRLALFSLGAACQPTTPGQALIPECRPGTCTEPFVAPDSALPSATVQGLVVDQTDLQGIRNATIQSRVTSHTSRADRSGRFRLERLRAGPDTVLIKALGYSPRVVPITIPSVGGLWLFTKLERAPDSLAH
jgi:hypothetical protein